MSANDDPAQQRPAVANVLARTLVGFQDQYLFAWPSQGILCQSWLPTCPSEVSVSAGSADQGTDRPSLSSHPVLRTKGNPFFLAGLSGADHLAFFRCISCRYTFGTDVNVPKELGAPGRVFLTGKPEVLGNVGAMAPEDFHRSDHAKTCMVQSCMILPVMDPESQFKCVGVIEVLTNNADLAYSRMSAMLAEQLAKHGLTTCQVSDQGSEGGGEVSPDLRQPHITPGAFAARAEPAKRSARDTPAEVPVGHGDGNGNGDGRVGMITGKDSVRLGLSLADLKTLMKQKRIKTLSRNSMGRYEEEVDLVLEAPAGTLQKVPSEKAIDSRWGAARRLPEKRRVLEAMERKKKERRKCMTRDFGDGGFPVVRQADGSLVADYAAIAENELRREMAAAGRRGSRGGGGVGGGGSVGGRAPRAQTGPSASPFEGAAGGPPVTDDGRDSGEQTLSAQGSDDWLGMMDPQMLELMVNDNVIDAIGNMDDIQLFG